MKIELKYIYLFHTGIFILLSNSSHKAKKIQLQYSLRTYIYFINIYLENTFSLLLQGDVILFILKCLLLPKSSPEVFIM